MLRVEEEAKTLGGHLKSKPLLTTEPLGDLSFS